MNLDIGSPAFKVNLDIGSPALRGNLDIDSPAQGKHDLGKS